MNTFQSFLGMRIHCFVFMAAFIVSTIPVIIIASILDTRTHCTIVCIFICCSQCNNIINRMTKAQTEFPRGVNSEIIRLMCRHRCSSISHCRIIRSCQIIPCRRIHIHTYTKCIRIKWTENRTKLDIITSTGNLSVIIQSQTRNFICVGNKVLGIFRMVAIMHVMQANCHTQINTIVDIPAQTDIIFTDITHVLFIIKITCSRIIIIFSCVLIIKKIIHIKPVYLVICHAFLVRKNFITILLIGQFVL